MISVDTPNVDLEFEDGDIFRSTVNGIPAIDFLKRIKRLLVKDMETTIVIKLLGRNIGYGILCNRTSSLWKPSQSFRVIDMKNNYYLVRFQNKVDYEMALTQEEIGSLVGKVAKLDIKINSGVRGQFAMIVVFVDLKKPLTSQVLINKRVQRVKVEALPVVCFTCGKYGYLKNLCSSYLAGRGNDDGRGDASNLVVKEVTPVTTGEAFSPWMVVECKSKRNQVDN
ncbi:hypothetical protein PVK06_048630 [Gossypium arboreum]|uniref:DUF4283 domain-containing protein n=1 Tax=Gossypium arboreum TaxID=29729 RepID=A0ABR0MGK0_GOSAR|nr:hypothetical protein PVK06_048630 [Gossypium arboreum]